MDDTQLEQVEPVEPVAPVEPVEPVMELAPETQDMGPEERLHTWYYYHMADDPAPLILDFPMPVNVIDAGNWALKSLGLDAMPDGAYVSKDAPVPVP